MELSDLINSIDILDYISQYTEFEEKGGEYWALSPLKDENTPSFSVRKEDNTFYDFSSGVGGNVLTFVRYYHHCGYQKAIQILQDYAGVKGDVQPHKKMAATEVAKRFKKKKTKPQKSHATVLPDHFMERYERREDKLAVWEAEGISKSSLKRFQVAYDAFSDRLVYPIRDVSGRIINVSGRTLDPDWKEKGLRKYTYFRSLGVLDTIYGLSENRDSILERHEIILFEGAKSVMKADTWGICNTGAILTSHLNPHQMRILITLGCRVVFALDKDVRVREDHNIRRLRQFVNVEYVWDKDGLLGEKDAPVDRGLEVWEKLYEGRLRYL